MPMAMEMSAPVSSLKMTGPATPPPGLVEQLDRAKILRAQSPEESQASPGMMDAQKVPVVAMTNELLGGTSLVASLEQYLRANYSNESIQQAAAIPSAGSALHATGECRPCAWHWKKGGCSNGSSCTFCHICDQDELSRRKKDKVARLRATKAEERFGTANGGIPTPETPPRRGSEVSTSESDDASSSYIISPGGSERLFKEHV